MGNSKLLDPPQAFKGMVTEIEYRLPYLFDTDEDGIVLLIEILLGWPSRGRVELTGYLDALIASDLTQTELNDLFVGQFEDTFVESGDPRELFHRISEGLKANIGNR